MKQFFYDVLDFQNHPLEDGNLAFGVDSLTMIDSQIIFNGSNNILFLEKGITLAHSSLCFEADNSVIYVASSKPFYQRLNVRVYNNSSFFIGNGAHTTGVVNIIVSEEKNVYIGDENMFAIGVWIRTADPHLIYSAKTHERTNASKSVFIGDHVWTGQGVVYLKGSQVQSGSIIGAMGVVPGKHIESNCTWAGNPVRKIADDIFWDETCVNPFTKETAAEYNTFPENSFIYETNPTEFISFEQMDAELTAAPTAKEKLKYLQHLQRTKTKNRFAMRTETPQGVGAKLRALLNLPPKAPKDDLYSKLPPGAVDASVPTRGKKPKPRKPEAEPQREVADAAEAATAETPAVPAAAPVETAAPETAPDEPAAEPADIPATDVPMTPEDADPYEA